MLIPFLQNLTAESSALNPLFTRNLLKEYLQFFVLDYIYSHPDYSQMVFYGGSCLAQCYGLPRLSEDLDFVDCKNKIGLSYLAKDIEKHFRENTDLEAKAAIQKFRIYLKIPILHKLGLASKHESDLLFLKVEVYNKFKFCDSCKIETIPLFKFNRSILVGTFDLPTLMATKIMAIFHRKWEKTDKMGKSAIKVKGRDYFDLMWYLQKGISPNLDCIEGVKDRNELKIMLLNIVENVDVKSIQLDLEAFIDNPEFVKNLSANIKKIITKELLLW
ncbi:MAG: nucleotidyl transferase AbiEii/AbiGii toxin family protein [Candidatus Margulisbacteria bacterium]|nr:nucleotidyl transferase AbiEii/AbiGii toxin family protein [Candidatus Margulisiibacteriota bacterium]